MSERSETISRLRNKLDARTSYIKAKLGVLVPSKIRALRMKSNMPRQRDLAKAAEMQQSRISMFETPGAANVTLETLARLAAAFKVGLVVDFVPFSEMLRWENSYSQNTFDVTRIDDDAEFIRPEAEPTANILIVGGHLNQTSNVSASMSVDTSARIAILPSKPVGGVQATLRPQAQAAAGG
ncbi:MAG: helix-turn-helix transcriptional regulator [Candidatus Acidiferrum sp.]